MNPTRRPGFPFSPLWLFLDLAGVAMMVAGALGLTGAGAALSLRLAEPAVAWTLLVCGAALAALAATFIVRDLGARKGGR